MTVIDTQVPCVTSLALTGKAINSVNTLPIVAINIFTVINIDSTSLSSKTRLTLAGKAVNSVNTLAIVAINIFTCCQAVIPIEIFSTPDFKANIELY
jgi:hypothetical protein